MTNFQKTEHVVHSLYPQAWENPVDLGLVEEIMEMQEYLNNVHYSTTDLWKMGQKKLEEIYEVLRQLVHSSEAYLY